MRNVIWYTYNSSCQFNEDNERRHVKSTNNALSTRKIYAKSQIYTDFSEDGIVKVFQHVPLFDIRK